MSIIEGAEDLTTVGFNKKSKLKVKAYCQIFDSNWTNIIELFGFYDMYYSYIKQEYTTYFEETGLRGLSRFCGSHPFIKKDVLYQLDLDKLKEDFGIQKFRYTDKDYKNNFLRLKKKFGRVPLYTEFMLNTKITIEAYALRYNLKGVVYDEVVRMFSSKHEYVEYKQLSDINQFEKLLLDKIAEILDTYYIPQATFKWLINNEGYGLSIDGYFEEYDLMVEADGQQHRVPMGYFGGKEKLTKQIKNDKTKNKIVRENGYSMLRVYIEDDWSNEDYLIDRLQEIGIKIPNQQIA